MELAIHWGRQSNNGYGDPKRTILREYIVGKPDLVQDGLRVQVRQDLLEEETFQPRRVLTHERNLYKDLKEGQCGRSIVSSVD